MRSFPPVAMVADLVSLAVGLTRERLQELADGYDRSIFTHAPRDEVRFSGISSASETIPVSAFKYAQNGTAYDRNILDYSTKFTSH